MLWVASQHSVLCSTTSRVAKCGQVWLSVTVSVFSAACFPSPPDLPLESAAQWLFTARLLALTYCSTSSRTDVWLSVTVSVFSAACPRLPIFPLDWQQLSVTVSVLSAACPRLLSFFPWPPSPFLYSRLVLQRLLIPNAQLFPPPLISSERVVRYSKASDMQPCSYFSRAIRSASKPFAPTCLFSACSHKQLSI